MRKKRVAIIGMATTSRHLAPYDDDEFEIWGLNESYWGGHQGPGTTSTTNCIPNG